MADSPPTHRTQICALLNELAEMSNQGEFVKAMAEVSLEARKGGGRAMGDHLSPCRCGGKERVTIFVLCSPKCASATRAHAMLRPTRLSRA